MTILGDLKQHTFILRFWRSEVWSGSVVGWIMPSTHFRLWLLDLINSTLYGKTLMLGRIEGKRRRGQQKMRCLDSMTDSMDMNLSKLREIVKERGAWYTAVHGIIKSRTWLSDWTTSDLINLVYLFTWLMLSSLSWQTQVLSCLDHSLYLDKLLSLNLIATVYMLVK